MNQYFTKTFFRFFFSFLAIIALSFGVILVASAVSPKPVDTVASPQ